MSSDPPPVPPPRPSVGPPPRSVQTDIDIEPILPFHLFPQTPREPILPFHLFPQTPHGPISHILSFLDLPSLYQASRACRLFRETLRFLFRSRQREFAMNELLILNQVLGFHGVSLRRESREFEQVRRRFRRFSRYLKKRRRGSGGGDGDGNDGGSDVSAEDDDDVVPGSVLVGTMLRALGPEVLQKRMRVYRIFIPAEEDPRRMWARKLVPTLLRVSVMTGIEGGEGSEGDAVVTVVAPIVDELLCHNPDDDDRHEYLSSSTTTTTTASSFPLWHVGAIATFVHGRQLGHLNGCFEVDFAASERKREELEKLATTTAQKNQKKGKSLLRFALGPVELSVVPIVLRGSSNSRSRRQRRKRARNPFLALPLTNPNPTASEEEQQQLDPDEVIGPVLDDDSNSNISSRLLRLAKKGIFVPFESVRTAIVGLRVDELRHFVRVYRLGSLTAERMKVATQSLLHLLLSSSSSSSDQFYNRRETEETEETEVFGESVAEMAKLLILGGGALWMRRDAAGLLPIALALRHKKGLPVFRYLLSLVREEHLGDFVTLECLLHEAAKRRTKESLGRRSQQQQQEVQQETNAIVRILLECPDVDVDYVDDQGRTALMHACFAGTVGVVKQLLAAGASVQVRDSHGKPTLAYVVELEGTPCVSDTEDSARNEILGCLLSQFRGVVVPVSHLRLLAKQAIRHHLFEVSASLMRMKGVGMAPSLLTRPLLLLAAGRSKIEFFRSLVVSIGFDFGPKKTTTTMTTTTTTAGGTKEKDSKSNNSLLLPLHIAAATGNFELVRLLVENGAFVNARWNGSDDVEVYLRLTTKMAVARKKKSRRKRRRKRQKQQREEEEEEEEGESEDEDTDTDSPLERQPDEADEREMDFEFLDESLTPDPDPRFAVDANGLMLPPGAPGAAATVSTSSPSSIAKEEGPSRSASITPLALAQRNRHEIVVQYLREHGGEI